MHVRGEGLNMQGRRKTEDSIGRFSKGNERVNKETESVASIRPTLSQTP